MSHGDRVQIELGVIASKPVNHFDGPIVRERQADCNPKWNGRLIDHQRAELIREMLSILMKQPSVAMGNDMNRHS